MPQQSSASPWTQTHTMQKHSCALWTCWLLVKLEEMFCWVWPVFYTLCSVTIVTSTRLVAPNCSGETSGKSTSPSWLLAFMSGPTLQSGEMQKAGKLHRHDFTPLACSEHRIPLDTNSSLKPGPDTFWAAVAPSISLLSQRDETTHS